MKDILEKRATQDGDLPHPVRSTFAEIRRHLDSRFSYLIFEGTSKSNDEEDFREVCTTLKTPEAGVLTQAFYDDSESGHLLLVAKLSPNSDQLWKDRMLAADLPKAVNFYFYERTGRVESVNRIKVHPKRKTVGPFQKRTEPSGGKR
jgi:hypothetical protein